MITPLQSIYIYPPDDIEHDALVELCNFYLLTLIDEREQFGLYKIEGSDPKQFYNLGLKMGTIYLNKEQ